MISTKEQSALLERQSKTQNSDEREGTNFAAMIIVVLLLAVATFGSFCSMKTAESTMKPAESVSMCVISDTHGLHRFQKLEPADILVHCGDIVSYYKFMEAGSTCGGIPMKETYKMTDEMYAKLPKHLKGTWEQRGTHSDIEIQLEDFMKWLVEIQSTYGYKHIVLIGGNHDYYLDESSNPEMAAEWRQKLDCIPNVHYFDEKTGMKNLMGVNFYGLPFLPGRDDAHFEPGPRANAFEICHNELAQHYAKIPENLDVLVTHWNDPAMLKRFREMSKGSEPRFSLSGHYHKDPNQTYWSKYPNEAGLKTDFYNAAQETMIIKNVGAKKGPDGVERYGHPVMLSVTPREL